jgi:3-keto-disaccharide hydrolase
MTDGGKPRSEEEAMAKRLFAATVVLLAIPVGANLALSSARPSKAGGWLNIMPPASFAGWTRVEIPPDRPLGKTSQWSVSPAAGIIVCAGDGGHEWLRYDLELGDFEFHVEWRLIKIADKEKYNSGVFVRNNENGSVWYQAQVGSPAAGFLFGENPEGAGLARFNLRAAMKGYPLKEVGKWNTYVIRCQGEKISLWVNGKKTSEFDRCNNPRGYLGLEAEGSRIEFRRLRIKTLP